MTLRHKSSERYEIFKKAIVAQAYSIQSRSVAFTTRRMGIMYRYIVLAMMNDIASLHARRCPICGIELKNFNSAKKHLFSCSECSSILIKKITALVDIYTELKQIEPSMTRCPICLKPFKNKFETAFHYMAAHKKKYLYDMVHGFIRF